MNKKKPWYDYLWIYTPVYLCLGMFNILFAWLGMIEFIVPLMISIFGGGKLFCNRYCGRGQLFDLLGNKLKLSRHQAPPKFLTSLWFRYGFLTFFMTMFILMILSSVQVFSGTQNLKEVVTILWTFKVPWQFAYHGTNYSMGIAQFAFGMYSIMLTSSLLGFITMLLYKPRSWCVYCPMGTMTQTICKLKKGGTSHGDAS
ncbi:4Fe-4S binding protein [Beduini massiliensis]|uniref:4Fe-4S binding protein n=1 Tax=Beduini massiliensis TaxID=1585974 RepID=UPI00059A99D7|nr:4Fe-4S binding protein [Beduini massiliensis]